MEKVIAVEVIPEEIRMALSVDGVLEKIFCERLDDEHKINRIYKGIIRNILPGMEAAFVDIGLGRNAYLKLQQPIQEYYGKKLFNGQSLLVQVVKEEMLGKAARVTTDISLAGRFIVLLPKSKGVHISKRIRDDGVREQLRNIVSPYTEKYGFIIRTSAVEATEEELIQDVQYLSHTFEQIERRFSLAKGGTELYRDADFWLRLVRDYFTKDVSQLIIDDTSSIERVKELLKRPTEMEKISYYNGDQPLFERLGLEEQLTALTNSSVPLPSGGELRIERTEALTVIDVNSKSYTGRTSNVADTALAVNKEAAIEACRQIRLRDIGGIIIIDFIDMNSDTHKEILMDVIRQECRRDRIKTVLCGITSLGLVELTRKRERQGLEEMLTDTCSSCGGSGYLLSAHTVYIQIIKKLIHLHRSNRIKGDILLQVHPEVKSIFTKKILKDLETRICKNIQIEETESVNRESYAILSL